MKKILSLLLSILMIMSVLGTSAVLANDDETEILGPEIGDNSLPEIAEGCNRYFFYMPKSWENEYSQTAGIYWFEGTGAHDSWPGVEAIKTDTVGVYYYDVPKDVDHIMWNNFFDGGNDRTTEEYYASKTTDNATMYTYEPGEHELYPDGIYDYNNMIFVVDFSRCDCLHWDYRSFGGNWYYYYGNGEYGTTAEKGEVVYTERSQNGEYCSHQEPEKPLTNLPEIAEGCNRYFFYQPENWMCEYSTTVGIYWWEGTGAQSSWPGLEAHKADAEGVYYYDVPKDVEYIIWNNYVQYSPDLVVGPEYDATRQTHEVYVGEYMIFDEMCDYIGMGNHDGDIYVTREKCFCDDYPECKKSSGMFYTYKGNGEYSGLYQNGEFVSSTEPVIDNHGGYQRPHIKGYNRLFFYMPDEFCNEYSSSPGIYWNTEISSSAEYPGTPMKPTDIEGMYYFDVPASVDEVYFTNLVDGGDDFTDPMYHAEIKVYAQTYTTDNFNIESYNGMLFVVDLACFEYVDNKIVFYGEWFEYYGFGEYGREYIYGEGDIYTDNALNRFRFEPIVLPYLVGDADGDGTINIKDATAIQKHIADIKKYNTIAGDVDFVGGLTVKDATAIQKYVAGIDTGYPINTTAYK